MSGVLQNGQIIGALAVDGSGVWGINNTGVNYGLIPGQKAFGGIVSTDGTDIIHTFNDTANLVMLQTVTVDYLVVAGGAGGSVGAGGAGGMKTGSTSLAAGTFVITVGGGGAKAATQAASGSDGTGSSIGATVTTTGDRKSTRLNSSHTAQ